MMVRRISVTKLREGQGKVITIGQSRVSLVAIEKGRLVLNIDSDEAVAVDDPSPTP